MYLNMYPPVEIKTWRISFRITTQKGTNKTKTDEDEEYSFCVEMSARPSPYAPPSATIPQILPSSISLDEVCP